MRQSVVTIVAFTNNVPINILGQALKRRRVTFMVSGATQQIFINNNAMTSLNTGIPLLGNSGPLVFDEKVNGDMVSMPWYIYPGFTGFLGIVETVEVD